MGSIATIDHDSPLGRFTSSHWTPDALHGLVDLWYSEGDGALPKERCLPIGMVGIGVVLGDPHRLVEGDGVEVLTSCVHGMQSRPIVLSHPDRHRVFGMRLHPFAAYALLGVPLREMNDLTVDLGDVIGSSASELGDRCHAAVSGEDCLRRAAAWLAPRLERARGVDEPIAWAARRIEASGGTVPIAELRERTGLPKSRLTEAFRDQVGFAPKLYARIVRFRRALSMLEAGEMSLVEVAVAVGYYDQPHMNAEFRELAGITPREFLVSHYPGGATTAAAIG